MTKYTTRLQLNGVLSFKGEDGAKFLQGQCSTNLDELSATKGLYGAFCTPKGRVKTTFILIQASEDELLMLMSADQCQYMQQELKPYIAFFKVELTDVSERYQVLGTIGSETNDSDENDLSVSKQGELIQVIPKSTNRRALVLIPQGQSVPADWQEDASITWHQWDIEDGYVWIDESNREKFLPHDIDLPNLGGVSFEKGCYTGQEIVARMHYRGNPKYCNGVLSVAEPGFVFEQSLNYIDESGDDKRLGTLIYQTERSGMGNIALVSVKKDLLEVGNLRLSNPSESTILCNIKKPDLL